MVDSIFEEALTGLCVKQDSKSLLKILVHIRRNVEWPKDFENIRKLQETGCLKYFVNILQMPQKNILDVCLSIIGNCMLDKNLARETFGTHNILSPLNHLLKRYPKEDSINGRIFRIVGNICYHKEKWANKIVDTKPLMIMHIVSFLENFSKDDVPAEEKYSEASAIMAIRALRLLLNDQTSKSLVSGFKILKTVGSILIKLSPEWQKNKSYQGILNNIIKLLLEYSRHQNYDSILEMRNTERGDSLIHLCHVLFLSHKKIVEIIMNLVKKSQLNSELPVQEICDKFLEEIMKKKYDTTGFKSECIEYIQCLCYLLGHPVPRNTRNCGNCLPQLIKVLDSFDKASNVDIECSIILIKTLNNFKYEDNLIQEQLKCNVIKVVLSKLFWVFSDSETLQFDHKRVKKRKISHDTFKNLLFADDSSDMESSRLSSQSPPPLSDDEFTSSVIPTYDRSPSPCLSLTSNGSHYTTWRRFSSSPYKEISESDDSADYSPVCSEADNASEDEKEDVAMIDEAEISDDNDSSVNRVSKTCNANLEARLIVEISKLVITYSRITPPIPILGTREVLLALIKSTFYQYLPSPVPIIRALSKILQIQAYLIPLMKTNFVEKIYTLTTPQHKSCFTCSDVVCLGHYVLRKLTVLAESQVGKGEIAHVLLRGTDDDKLKLVLAIPYIITNKPILAKLMINCGGLKILMRLLKDDASLKNRIVTVLCALASKQLGMANPKVVAIDPDSCLLTEKTTTPEDGSEVVKIQLDDGSLMADRVCLIENSDFFRGLLDGHFKESGKCKVKLQNVKSKSMRCLLQIMKGDERISRIVSKLDISTVLDVITLTDRFLMQELCTRITSCVERKLSSSNVHTIYKWSIESGLNMLRVEVVAYALASDVDDASRRAIFNSLIELGYTDELIDDLHKMLARYIGNSNEFS